MSETNKSECFCMGAGPAITEAMKHLGPEAARDHFRNSRLEFLKGIRALLDERISVLSKPEQKGSAIPVD